MSHPIVNVKKPLNNPTATGSANSGVSNSEIGETM